MLSSRDIVGQGPGARWPAVNAYQGAYRGHALDNIVAKFTAAANFYER